jgi:hypothetical protein
MPNSVVKSLAKKSGRSVDEVEGLWDKAVSLAGKKGLSQDSDNFYAYVTGILKRMLKTESILLQDSEIVVDSYLDGTPHRLRAEPIGSASTIFKRDKFLRRRNERDKKKIPSGKKKEKPNDEKKKP